MGTQAEIRRPVLALNVWAELNGGADSRISVLFSSHSFNASGESPRVFLSTSIKTGSAPVYLIAFAVAINVRAWVITSSPPCTPTSCKAIWRAAVPFTVATAYLAPVYSAHSCSKRPTNSPTLDTKFESIHSIRYFFSLPVIRGSCSGIKASGSL